MLNRYVVIMAGGRGERFWPESRLKRPKQLLPIVGEKPMLAQTIDRLQGSVPVENIFVITNVAQREAVLDVCPNLDPEKIIGEPIGRDTAAAVGLATILVRRENPDAAFAILPADAVIHNANGFRSTLESAFCAAESNPMLVTIGIKATYPAVGYGYIQQGKPIGVFAGNPVFKVQRFVEKPKSEVAETYLKSGDYFWNAGMFVWSVATIAAELNIHTPQLWKILQTINDGLDENVAIEDLLGQHYPRIKKISIDYAIIEKAENIAMVKSQFDWDDVGEWPALGRHYPSDEKANVARGLVHLQDSGGNIVFSRDKGHLIALFGVDDLVVVKTDDATLVCHKDKVNEIKDLVSAIGNKDAWTSFM